MRPIVIIGASELEVGRMISCLLIAGCHPETQRKELMDVGQV